MLAPWAAASLLLCWVLCVVLLGSKLLVPRHRAHSTMERFSSADSADPVLVAVHESKSHKIEVTETPGRGTCVALDGRTQFCSHDEHMYHEMLVHFPAQYLQGGSPRRVLIASGGDCHALREVLKHTNVQEVVVIERDEALVSISEKHLLLSAQRTDPRVTWLFGDNPTELLVRLQNQSNGRRIKTGAMFDMVIVDRKDRPGNDGYSTDSFYKEARLLMTHSGVLVRNGLRHQAPLAAIFGHTLSYAFKKGPDAEEVGMVIAADFVLKAHVVNEQSMADNKVHTRFYRPEAHASHIMLPKPVNNVTSAAVAAAAAS